MPTEADTCRKLVVPKLQAAVRLVNSMVEFKQIIGRGTRVRDDYGKLWFNILDYTGSATRLFADPALDGDPGDRRVVEVRFDRDDRGDQ